MTEVATRRKTTAIARPLKTLIPLIQDDLRKAVVAGEPYYLAAGEKLTEARPQVTVGSWGGWVNRHFGIGKDQARRYMLAAAKYAEHMASQDDAGPAPALHVLTGEAESQRKRDRRRNTVRRATAAVDVEHLAQEKQTQKDEISLHRELAQELIDIGYKALATRLHPDRRGGSRDAMARLNRVREELREVAATRRFV